MITTATLKHKLKTINPFFEAVWQDKKTFEIRKNDRNFQVGEYIKLEEFCDKTNIKSGRSITVRIIYILDNEKFLQPGYICMSIEELWRKDHEECTD